MNINSRLALMRCMHQNFANFNVLYLKKSRGLEFTRGRNFAFSIDFALGLNTVLHVIMYRLTLTVYCRHISYVFGQGNVMKVLLEM